MSQGSDGGRRRREPEPFPGSTDGRPFTDDEVREFGYTHRDSDGYWVGLDTLAPEERAARERQKQRARHALLHPTSVTNPNAMRDALVDAMGDRPTIGGIRRGAKVRTAMRTFDWDAVRRRADTQHAADVQSVINPRPEHIETRRPARQRRNGERTDNADRAYGTAVLDAECWRVAQTPPGNRHNVLVSAAFKVGRRVGAGYLAYDEAFANLLGAALDSGMAERRARLAIRSALRAGARNPKGAAA